MVATAECPLKVAIIGAGLIGNKRAAALKRLNDCRLVVTSDIKLPAAKTLADQFGGEADSNWENVIGRKDIDLVVVATFNKDLAPISISALRNGKHVLCEKPLGRNVRESEAILETALKNGVTLKTGFNHRHHPAISRAHQLASEGSLGAIYYAKATYGHGGRPGYEKEWRSSKDLCGGGELLDQGVHVVDLFRWFMGDFEEAFGYTPTCCWNMEVEDNVFALFRTSCGKIATMHTSWTQWKNRFTFEVFGELGYLIVDGLGGSYGTETLRIGKRRKVEGERIDTEKPLAIGYQPSIQYAGGPPDEEIIEFPGPDVSWAEEWKEFVTAIREKREPLGNGQDGLEANRMIEAVYRSARENRPVKIS